MRESGVETPALFMTAFSDARVRKQALDLNSSVIDKPLGAEDALKIVHQAMGDYDRKRRQLIAKTRSPFDN